MKFIAKKQKPVIQRDVLFTLLYKDPVWVHVINNMMMSLGQSDSICYRFSFLCFDSNILPENIKELADVYLIGSHEMPSLTPVGLPEMSKFKEKVLVPLKKHLSNPNPDIIIAPSTFDYFTCIKQYYPDSLVLHFEGSIFTREPYAPMCSMDPAGSTYSYIMQYWPEIENKFTLDDKQLKSLFWLKIRYCLVPVK